MCSSPTSNTDLYFAKLLRKALVSISRVFAINVLKLSLIYSTWTIMGLKLYICTHAETTCMCRILYILIENLLYIITVPYTWLQDILYALYIEQYHMQGVFMSFFFGRYAYMFWTILGMSGVKATSSSLLRSQLCQSVQRCTWSTVKQLFFKLMN